MNGATTKKTEYAAWRGLFSQPDTEKLCVAAAIFTASALIVPLSVNETLAMLFIAVCAFFYYLQTRTLTSLFLPALPTIILFSLGGSMMLPAAFFGIVFGGACGAMLIISVKNKKFYLLFALLPIAAYLIAFAVKGDPINALLTLIPLPVAIVAALVLIYAKPFVEAHLWLMGVIAAALLVALVITMAMLGILYPGFLTDLIEVLTKELTAMIGEASAAYAEAGIAFSISETDLKNTIAMTVNLSPAIFLVLSMITAYFTNLVMHRMLIGFGVLPRLPQRLTVPIVSVFAAVLFIFAYLVSLFGSTGEATVVGVVASNISLILEPCLAYLGFLLLFHRRESRSCLSLVFLFLMIGTLWLDPSLFIVLAAFYGAANVIIAAVMRKKAQ